MVLKDHYKEFAIKAFAKYLTCKQVVKAFVQEFPDELPNLSQPENKRQKEPTGPKNNRNHNEIQNIYESIGNNAANPYHQRHISRYQIPEFKNVPILKNEISKYLLDNHKQTQTMTELIHGTENRTKTVP